MGKISGVIKSRRSSIKEPKLRLKDFSRNTIPMKAQVTVRVTSAQKSKDTEFYVIAGAEPSCLLGLSTSQALGLVTSSEVVLTGGKTIALPSKKAAQKRNTPETGSVGIARLITACKVPCEHSIRM